MIYFDEKSIAERMHDKQRFEKTYCVSELAIYAKWVRYKKSLELKKELEDFTDEENATVDKEIERELISFSEKAYPSFNYTVNYVEIDNAIDISRKFKLKLPTPTPITEAEWETIISINNDDYQRVLFVALVDAKYYSMNHTTVGKEASSQLQYWNRMTDDETIKISKANLQSSKDKVAVWHYLYQNGFVGITPGKDHVPYTNIVNNDSDIIDYVTDYDHIDLHYDKLLGKNIGCCKYCGRLFKQTKSNNADYCYKHRGYRKIGIRFGKCIDCGREFSFGSKSRLKERCPDCQAIVRRNTYRLSKQKSRNSLCPQVN